MPSLATRSSDLSPWALCSALPALLTCLLLASCGLTSGELFTVWGPLNDPDNSDIPSYSWGGSFGVTGLAHQVSVDDPTLGPRDFLEVVLLSGTSKVSCNVYTDYLAEIRELQGYVDELRAEVPVSPSVAEWREYVCQQINGAALRAFGGDGSYRAVHVLMLLDSLGTGPEAGVFGPRRTGSEDLANGNTRFFGAEVFDPATPGAESQLPAWTYVSRTYERSQHGEDVLPPSGDEGWVDSDPDPADVCTSLLGTFETELTTPINEYPDTRSMVLQAATNRYYHKYTTQVSMELGKNLEPLPHGLVLPRWSEVATSGDDLGIVVIGRASRTPAGMPYERLVMTSRSDAVPLTPCDSLGEDLSVVWPELF